MEILLITSIFIIGIGFLVKWIGKYKNFGIELNEENGLKFLLGWIIFGFLARLDYSDAWGCIVSLEPILEPRNILFSTISFGLIFWAFKTDDSRIRKTLYLTELAYWISKLMIFKGGYVIGYGAMPGFTIVFYDLVSAIVRLFILSQIPKVVRLRFIKIGVITLLILGIKISIFATQLYMIYEERQAFEEAKEVRKGLVGVWHGIVKKVEAEQIEFEEITNIQIDSQSIYFDSIVGLESRYLFILDHPNFGLLSKEGKYHDYNLSIEKRNKDSLIIKIGDLFERYEFNLKKE